jgi:PAS domain-containing protein
MSIGFWLSLFLVSCSAALAVVFISGWVVPRRAVGEASVFHDRQDVPIFLFDEDRLIDASDAGRALLAGSRLRGSAMARFLAWAAPRFPGLEEALASLPEKGRVSIQARNQDPTLLRAEWRGGLRRIEITDLNRDVQATTVDTLTRRAVEDELSNLRRIADAAPLAIWSEGPDSRVTWANAAYMALLSRHDAAAELGSWPVPRLFMMHGQQPRQRQALTLGQTQHWFDCHMIDDGQTRFNYAVPADDVMQAEQALRSFVQTLTKTFAQLPIGLAIFDAQRKLQLFNPALTDLTGLPVGFLSARPALFAFLDAMRERQMIPEPRDYKTWRAKMAALEESAVEGSYDETWTLLNGATYQVSGRPHPEGALALLIRDVSDDMQRARRARAETELSQAVIEAMDEAIVVFSATGDLLVSNAAYANLWGHDPRTSLEAVDIAGLAAKWRGQTGPAAVWTLAEAFALAPAPRESWTSEVLLKDGRRLAGRFMPLPGGATLCGFRDLSHRTEIRPPDAPPGAEIPFTRAAVG